MSAAKHTPGPWATSTRGRDTHVVKSPDGDAVALLEGAGCLPSETRANARLIAAAPELLEACKVAFEQTCSVGRPKDWEQLRAAIAKATGSAT